MLAAVALIASLASEVLALVNGKPITRAQLESVLSERERQAYHEAVADLQEDEHAAVRDFLGRQAVERATGDGRVARDSVYARTMASDFDSFDPNLRNRIQQQRERIYSLERSALDQLIDQRLFEAAAKSRGLTADELTRTLAGRTAPVTKADVEFIKAYEQSKQSVSVSAPPGEGRLQAAIREARLAGLRTAFLDSVRQQSQVGSRLAPPRVTVSTAGAAVVGPPSAPVRIVVFTDFECPYCREAEYTLKTLREQYGDRLSIYYMNYPLPNHLYAQPAAVAATCAEAQGKYMAYHDYLFAHQEELKTADYAAWAEKAGLDRKAFEAYQASGEPKRRVEQHIREGVAAGVSSTPTFLVNGRLVTDADGLMRAVTEEAAAHR
jgi:protein-disulfide isomerase